MKKDRTVWCALVMVLVGQLGAYHTSGSTRAYGFPFVETDKGRRSAAFLATRGEEESPYIAPYVPTPQEVVNRMLEIAEVRPGDVVYDLGSGDGRIVITAAARYGVKAVGFEISPNLVKRSRDNVKEAGLEHLVDIREEDIRTVDLSPASVVTLYLYPSANLRLRSMIMDQLKPGSRVVSHQFTMGNWKADRVEQITDSTGISRTLYLWRIGKTR
ncbi:MAG TPA: class I SAM-dependent methyltransferase [Candidatus Binatia bacterium]|nr:class I SAM-dependent methyltransferase [Candidatus Binatia bacterium]